MSTRSVMPMYGVFLIICSMINLSLSEENMSLMKPASQSGLYTDGSGAHPASRAVDGCVDQDLSSGCCCHTASDELTAWWSVDLGQPSNIQNITILYRAAFKNRFAGYKLYVSNGTQTVLCYEDTNGIEDDVRVTVTHSCPYVATHVTLFNYRNDPTRHSWYSSTAYIELCEMQVFGCPLGSFGNGDCNQTCSGCNGGICDPVTGLCLDGCITGRYGSSCENDCSATCSMNECNADSGHCLKCIPGYYGNTCNQDCSTGCTGGICDKDSGRCDECADGFFGLDCDRCSTECTNSVCDKRYGNCTGCKQGFYGHHCSEACKSTCKNVACIQDTGHCLECNAGYYGDHCDKECSSGCMEKMCDRTTGHCTGCKLGIHGENCSNTCPTNCKDNTCIQDNGHCPECEPGYYGDHCDINCNSRCIYNICDKTTGQCKETINVQAVVVGATCGVVIAVLVVMNIILVKHLKP